MISSERWIEKISRLVGWLAIKRSGGMGRLRVEQ